jgi:Major intrinsic protein
MLTAAPWQCGTSWYVPPYRKWRSLAIFRTGNAAHLLPDGRHFGNATDTRAVGQAAALAIGATVGLEALFAGPISGASMNPARSLGSALMSWTWTAQWVYLLGPMIGAVAGACVYRWLREASEHPTSAQRLEPTDVRHKTKENENV